MCYTPYVFLLLLLLLHLYTVESGSQTWSTEAPNPAWKHTWDKNRHVQCKAMYSVTADPVKLNQTAAFMWKLAREQVGLSAESDCSSQILIVHDFSFMQTRANNGRAVNYVHMWKGESENICRNILSFAPARDDGTSIHHTFTPFTRASWERDADDGQEEEELNTFTFVRHPLARFEDAMRQYLWQCADGLGLRNYRRTTGHSIGEQRRTVDSDFIVKDIDRLLCSCQLRRCPGNTHPHTPHYHILPQATVLASYIKGEKVRFMLPSPLYLFISGCLTLCLLRSSAYFLYTLYPHSWYSCLRISQLMYSIQCLMRCIQI